MAKKPISIEALKHDATRINIPTAEFESLMREEDKSPIQVAYERRNRDLDPQLVWRGKDEQDWSDLIVQAPPLYVQEKLHPKALIDDLKRQTKARKAEADDTIPDLFADFNGLPDKEAVTEFYQHDLHWSNRMISGDSLSVMASLAEREGLRGQVQCIYFDPPYGIKFNSNFQWSTTSREVKDGAKDQVTREPEQVRAFRDTWKDGIHSYLTYLRDRLTVARDLLSDSGSIFVQIGDENVHRVRALMDEIFGDENIIAELVVAKTTSATSELIPSICDYVIWAAKDKSRVKYRQLFNPKVPGLAGATGYTKIRLADGSIRPLTATERAGTVAAGTRILATGDMTSQRPPGSFPVNFLGSAYRPVKGYWKTGEVGFPRLIKSDRIYPTSGGRLAYIRYLDDFPAFPITNIWTDTVGQNQFAGDKLYVVQTANKIIERCLLMATDPGDLVLDPTCGSGTTAYVAEQWGRRWITIDTSRVAIALARSRLMGARYAYYLLADSPDGQRMEAEITRSPPKTSSTYGSIRQGFVYERVPRVTLKSIANNSEIDAIWDRMQPPVQSAVDALNAALKGHATPFRVGVGSRAGAKIDFSVSGEMPLPSGEAAPINALLEWEVPRASPADWPAPAREFLARFWEARLARQKEMDASIAARAESEYLYDKPYSDGSTVRVAGPFTVESLSPHITMAVGPDDELIDLSGAGMSDGEATFDSGDDFACMILKNLRVAGVQQAHKEDRITFTSLIGWPGQLICAEGRYLEGDVEKRAGIFIGPEFGTVSRPDLVQAAREAGDAGFDVLVACAFNYDAHSAEFSKLGRVPVLRARMNPDLHMAGDLAATGAGNLFVIFGEPDIQIEDAGKDADGADLIRVKVSGVDVFKPQTGAVESEGTDGIALWMLDTDYNEESFFVRHAYFLGANDPYKALKTTLKAEIDEEAWSSLNSDTSRPFPKPTSGRIAVKVINHLGDEVMKVFEAR
jgi:adenine-specific DNA-methyltransferase